MMKEFYVLIWMYVFAKTFHYIYMKSALFILCRLYLMKEIKKEDG